MAKTEWSEHKLTELLAARHSGGDWAFLRGVPNGTGMAKSRTCDGMAMSLWPSKGLHLHGFEIKISRSDWQREIQDPSKAEAFAKHCHYWWIVAPKGVVQLPELPGRWGLMEPAGKGLRVRKAADIRESPEQPDWTFLAGLLRAACKQSPSDEALTAARDQGFADGRQCEKRRDTRDTDNYIERKNHELLQKTVAEFEEASGIKIGLYGGRRLGEAVELVRCAEFPSLLRSLRNVEQQLSNAVAEVDGAADRIEEVMKTTTST